LRAITDWFQVGIAGLSPITSAYHLFRVAPVIVSGLTHATATIETPFGLSKSAWQLKDNIVKLEVVVSCGTSAEICLGDGHTEDVGSGTHYFQ
jgi:alpha-L-rhamnosidase